MRTYEVVSADGTVLRAWTNDGDGPLVLLCNGLGTNPYCWPALDDPGCGVRLVSWYHRGVGGSQRPADPDAIGMDAMVDDAVAVLDSTGEDRAVLAGWSIGVNTSFELAVTHPERTRGLFAVCGVPGNTFATMLSPLRIPRPLRKPLTVSAARVLGAVGAPLSPLVRGVAGLPWAEQVTRYTGFVLPSADPEQVRKAMTEFVTTDVGWYFRLAAAMSDHPRVSLSRIGVPTTFVAGRYDLLAGQHEIRTAAERIPDAKLVTLPSSHFASLEFPDKVHAELLDLVGRALP